MGCCTRTSGEEGKRGHGHRKELFQGKEDYSSRGNKGFSERSRRKIWSFFFNFIAFLTHLINLSKVGQKSQGHSYAKILGEPNFFYQRNFLVRSFQKFFETTKNLHQRNFCHLAGNFTSFEEFCVGFHISYHI